MAIKVKVGDVFQIPISDDECGYGQILAKYQKEMLLIVVFSVRTTKRDKPALGEIVSSTPLFLGNSLDGKLWHGHWPIVGNVEPNLSALPLPKYKVKIGPTMVVESFDARKTRPAERAELEVLDFRKCVSPVVLEKALKAHWGLGEWEDRFDSLKADRALQSSSVPL